jgi:hypothetical protein
VDTPSIVGGGHEDATNERHKPTDECPLDVFRRARVQENNEKLVECGLSEFIVRHPKPTQASQLQVDEFDIVHSPYVPSSESESDSDSDHDNSIESDTSTGIPRLVKVVPKHTTSTPPDLDTRTSKQHSQPGNQDTTPFPMDDVEGNVAPPCM